MIESNNASTDYLLTKLHFYPFSVEWEGGSCRENEEDKDDEKYPHEPLNF